MELGDDQVVVAVEGFCGASVDMVNIVFSVGSAHEVVELSVFVWGPVRSVFECARGSVCKLSSLWELEPGLWKTESF